MRFRRLILVVAAAAPVGVCSGALGQPIVIPTQFGQGADAEVRESALNTFTPLGGDPIVRGQNFGAANELATRLKDDVGTGANPTPPPDTIITTPFVSNDRSSIMYMKFDLSALPASTDPFWSSARVSLQMFVRTNGNIQGNDLWAVVPGGDSMNVADYRLMQFGIKGLDPNATYDNSAGGRADRLGNAYTASFNQYNWTEGAGQDGDNNPTGITYYNAPGLQPHCVSPTAGACVDPNIPDSDDSAIQTLGILDDWDASQVVDIEESWHWPNETEAASYTSTAGSPATLLAGQPLDYKDPNGNLKALLLDALAAAEGGGDPVMTLMVYHNLDGTVDKPDVGRPGTTPASFLNQNYVAIPKDFTTAGNSIADNTDGSLSPRLLIVPEPASVSLVALGLLAALGLARRRR